MVKLIVIDNSALIPLFMPDESSVLMEQIIKLTAEGTRLLSPSFVAIEFGNTMLTGMKRGRLSTADVEFAHAQFYELPIELVDFVGRRTIPSIHSIALQQQLSFYDALYLALAMEEGAALASNDEELNKAAITIGVEVLNPTGEKLVAKELSIAKQMIGLDKDE